MQSGKVRVSNAVGRLERGAILSLSPRQLAGPLLFLSLSSPLPTRPLTLFTVQCSISTQCGVYCAVLYQYPVWCILCSALSVPSVVYTVQCSISTQCGVYCAVLYQYPVWCILWMSIEECTPPIRKFRQSDIIAQNTPAFKKCRQSDIVP